MTRLARARWLKSVFDAATRGRPRRPASPISCEQLEDRLAPASLPPGNYSGTIAADSEFDQPGTYTITGDLTVNTNRTLRVGETAAGTPVAGVNVVLNTLVSVTVSGTLRVTGPATFAVQDQNGGGTHGVTITSSGSLVATGAVFSRVGGFNGGRTTQVVVQAGGSFTATSSTFGWDRVQLDNSSTLGTVTDTAFDGVLGVQAESVPALAGPTGTRNLRFQNVEINGNTTGTTANLTFAPMGQTTTNQQYVFPAGFTVGTSRSLTFAADSKVVVRSNVDVVVAGTLTVTSPALFAVDDENGGGTGGVVVRSGGALAAAGAVFSRTGGFNGGRTTRVLVEAGGSFTATSSTFGWDRVQLDNNSTPAVTDSAFDGVLGVQAEFVPLLAGPAGVRNRRFQDIEINGGSTTGASLTLAPVGQDVTNQRYVFPAAFTVTATTALVVASDARVKVNTNVDLTVGGTLTVTSPALFAVDDENGGGTGGVVVRSGGALAAAGAVFSRTGGFNGGRTTRVLVEAGGSFTATSSTFGWDRVQLDNGSTLSVTDSAFDGVLGVAAESVAALAGPAGARNRRFRDVEMNGNTTGTATNVTLAPLGADTTNQRYVFPADLTVGAGTTLAVAAGANVVVRSNVNLTAAGVFSVTDPGSFAMDDENGGGTGGIVVPTGGALVATNTVFGRSGSFNGGRTTRIQVNQGGQLIARGGSFGWDQLVLASGSRPDVQYAFFNTDFRVNSGADLAGNPIRNNDLSAVTGAASGTTGTFVNLRDNYWNATAPAAIDAKMTDKTENTALPQILYDPFLSTRPVQAAGATPAPVQYSGAAGQSVALTASVRAPGASGLVNVNEGTVTFTIRSGATTIGTPVTVGVSAGVAAASYTIPQGTAGGTYVVEVVYNGTTSFSASTDATTTLTITAAPASGAAGTATATYSGSAQSVTLSATITSAAGPVNGGTVRFTVLNGATVIGNPTVSSAVVGGAASVSYALPAGLAGGTYTVAVTYLGSPSFQGFTGTAGTLTVGTAAASASAGAGAATYSLGAGTVALSATVTSAAGVVNGGTVTFTVLNGATAVGTATTSAAVVNGSAAVSYALPAGLGAGTYTIQVVYNGSANFAASAAGSGTLTVSPAATTSAAASATAVVSTGSQVVALSATVTTASGPVNGGTVTFTVLNGATVVGTATTSAAVASGSAAANYTLPAGTPVGTYTVTAAYSGTANLAASTGAAGSLVVSAAPAAVAATSATATYAVAAQSVTLSATVTSAAGTVNEGTVTFTLLTAGGAVVGTATTSGVVSGGAAAVSYALPAGTPAGTLTIRAVYNGTANFGGSTDTSKTVTVAAATSAVAAATASAAYSTAGQSLSLTATVTSPAGAVSQGTVTFTVRQGATVIGTPVTSGTVAAGSATAAYTLPAGTPAGAYTIHAAYNGTANVGGSADSPRALTVTAAASATAAADASVAVSAGSQVVNLTATVTSPAGAVNQGAVTFTVRQGATVIGTPVVSATVANGVVAVAYTLPAGTPAGVYVIEAAYGGTANVTASADATRTLTVFLGATVASTAGPVNEGTITFTLLNGATVVGTPVTSGVVSGGAAGVGYTLPAGTPAGTLTVRAVYSGTPNFTSSTDAAHALTISPAGTTTAAADAAVGFSAAGQSVNLTAAVTSPAGAVNAGTVTFTLLRGATVVGTPTTSAAVANGAASVSYALPAGTTAGALTIRAVYAGTADLVTSTDQAHALTVSPAATTTAAAAAAAVFSAAAQVVNLSAAVISAAGVVAGGTVTFTLRQGATVIGSGVTAAVTSGSAAAAYALPAGTPAGAYTIDAVYGGTADLAASADATHVLTVGVAATTTTPAPVAVEVGAAPAGVTVSVTVASAAGTVTGGTVTFTIAGVAGAPVVAAVVGGTASATYTFPAGTPAGTYAVQAAFAGATSFAASSGTAAAVVTSPAVAEPSAVLVGTPQFAAGAGAGGSGRVTVYNADATPAYSVLAFAGTTGARTAVADFNGDGTPDLAAGTGPGAVAEVVVFDGTTGQPLFSTRPFADFTGGVFVAAGDVTGDGKADLVVTPDEGGGPRVTLYRGGAFTVAANFFGIDDANFRGGARAALGDLNADGRADLVISAGFGGGPRVAGFDGVALAAGDAGRKLFNDFFLFEPALRNGAYVAVGDVDGDGFADLIGGGGPGGGPRVYALSGRELLAGRDRVLANFFAGDLSNRGGIRVAVKDLDGDPFADLVVGAGAGAGSGVTGFAGKNFGGGGAPAEFGFDAFPGLTTGVFVG